MTTDEYWKRFYCKTITDGTDALTVSKSSDTDWSIIEMRINGSSNGLITIRDKEHAESLVHMLNQMLGARQC